MLFFVDFEREEHASSINQKNQQKFLVSTTPKNLGIGSDVRTNTLQVRSQNDRVISPRIITGHQNKNWSIITDRSRPGSDTEEPQKDYDDYLAKRGNVNTPRSVGIDNRGAIKRPDIPTNHQRNRERIFREKESDRAAPTLVLPGWQENWPDQNETRANNLVIRENRNHQEGNQRGLPSNRARRLCIIDFRKLVELGALSPEELTLQLLQYKESMQELLDKHELEPDWIHLILLIFAKISESTMPHNLIQLFSMLQNTHFLQTTLGRELLQMSIKGQDKIQDLLENALKVCTTYLKLFPSSYLDLPIDILKSILSRTRLFNIEYLQDQVNRLAQIRDEIMENELKAREVRSRDRFLNEKPPEDFRQIQTVPAKDDLNPDKTTYLRPIKNKGRYEDVDQYLDIQYRLLREDFIGPLREGIKEVTDQVPRAKRLQDIKVYYKVHVLYPQCTKSGIIHRIEFDVSHLSRVPWKHTKRLIFGALVCFSNDNFQTCLFATVANRDPKDLEHGEIDVRFVDGHNTVANVQRSDEFTMIESPAYFEAYRYVLEGVQELDEHTLPLQRYIISCNADVNPPGYLMTFNALQYGASKQVYDLKESLGTDGNKGKSVHILDQYAWPSPEEVALNQSQLEAMQQALTREFVVIQGPPGTGKTHVGLRIAHALLTNKRSWQQEEKRPMLIVCYTNHALDQFLEGLIRFGHKNLIRVGGRSTSEELKGYNLKRRYQTQRKQARHGIIGSREFSNRLHRLRVAKSTLFSDKMVYEWQLSGVSRDAEQVHKYMVNGKLLSLNHLSDYMGSYMQHVFYNIDLQTRQMNIPVFDVWLGLCPVSLEELGIDVTFQQQIRPDCKDIFIRCENIYIRQPIREGVIADGEDKESDNDDNDESIDIEGEGNVLEDRWAADTDEFRPEPHSPVLEHDAVDPGPQVFVDTDGFQYVEQRRKDRQRIIRRQLLTINPMTEEEVEYVHNPFTLSQNDRWRLYKYWILKCMERCREKFAESGNHFDEFCQRIKEVQEEEDEIILQQCDVVGMTTTCAARSRRILRSIKPKIVIVEEAAEVLEAHVLTALSKDTQHLILIGDHKQLKPNPTVYKLAREYNLELSMFERMINNGMDCRMLNIQHRMRPEIAKLLRHVYKGLQNHETVENYETIKGIRGNVYFINHSFPEQNNEDSKSKSNQHEADYIVGLCRYLLLQGYKPEQITILTMYTGQLLLLKKLMRRSNFEGVQVTAVDNFQGEENDIVLASLVRSNMDGKIGFLNIENRVCVALSRAKKGLYVIGNFDLLAGKSSLWSKIVHDLKVDNRIGKALTLTCQNHPTKIISAEDAKDFKNAPDGGCNQPCTYRLLCGHVCDKACHPVDPDHTKYKCKKPCSKLVCDLEHLCNKSCHYGKECGPCMTSVAKLLPKCRHYQLMPCSKDSTCHFCTEKCNKKLACGHPCTGKCGEICEDTKCMSIKFKEAKCGHTVAAACSASIDEIVCKQPCKTVLKCGHPCSGDCGICKNKRLHVSCKSPCERVLICSHLCKEPCTNQCPPCKEKCQNKCPHSKCGQTCGNVCEPCKEPCLWACRHHQCTMPCGQLCNRPPCNEPCVKLLKCMHPCIGLCGEKCPKVCRICNKDKVEEIFFGTENEPDSRFIQLEDCGHVLEVSGLDQWMEMSQTGENGKLINIQLKGCPMCKTPIQRSLRYGNIVKSILQDINDVKQKILQGDKGELLKLDEKISVEINNIERKFVPYFEVEHKRLTALTRYQHARREESRFSEEGRLVQTLRSISKSCSSIIQAQVLQNQVQFCHHLLKLKKQLKETKERLNRPYSSPRFIPLTKNYKIDENITTLSAFIMQKTLTSQQMEDIQLELSRMQFLVYLIELECQLQEKPSSALTKEEKQTVEKASKLLLSGRRIEEALLDQLRKAFQTIRKKVGLTLLTNNERLMIIQTTGSAQGNWYKCPKGHYYAIGDCGCANEEGKCPECGAKIEGRSHQLAAGNAHAGEFDGSRYATWSEGANLENFDLEQLRRLHLEE